MTRADDPPPAHWRDLLEPALLPRLAIVCLGVWLNAADNLVTVTIMPSVGADMGGPAYYGWASASFLLGAILAGASAGRMSERLGLSRASAIAAVIYAAGCALSAASSGIGLFLAGRLAQGIGAGWIAGFAYVAVSLVFPERLWARVFGLTAGVWGVATVLGPLVGGLFVAAGSWRGAFWTFAAQGLVFAVAAPALLTGSAKGADMNRGLPWRTLVALTLAILAIAGADLAPGKVLPVVLTLGGFAGLALAIRINGMAGERLLPVEAARPNTAAGAGYAMIFALSAATGAFGVYGAAALQTVYGLPALGAGYVISMDAVGWTIAAVLVSGQPDARQPMYIRLGAATVLAGVALLAATIASRGLPAVIVSAGVLGVGFGLCWSLATRRILASLPDDERAVGSSAVPTTQMIGGAAGAAAAGAVANLLGLAQAFTSDNAVRLGPWLFAAFIPVAALGVLAALRLARG